MIYEFICMECPSTAIDPDTGKHLAGYSTRDYPMTKAPPVGRKVKCPGCNRKTAARIFSSGTQAIVKGTSTPTWNPGETFRTNINGQDVRFAFVDHKHTDPMYQRNLAELAGRNHITGNAAGLSNARYDERSGRVVVDVASNVPDPLGRLSRPLAEAKKRGTYSRQKVNVNTPYRVRGKK